MPTPSLRPMSTADIFVLPFVLLLAALLLWQLGGNVPLFEWLHPALFSLGGTLWSHLTLLGDSALTPLLLVIYVRRRPDLLWAALLGSLIAYGYSHSLKPLVDELRPPAVLPGLEIIGPRLMHSSFPSGHTTSIFTLAGLLILGVPLRDRACRVGVLVLAALVGLSRIGVGVHWPVDVLVGAAGGWLSAAAGIALARSWTWGDHGYGRALPIGMLGLLGFYNLIGNPTGFADVRVLQVSLSVLALAWLAVELMRWKREASTA